MNGKTGSIVVCLAMGGVSDQALTHAVEFQFYYGQGPSIVFRVYIIIVLWCICEGVTGYGHYTQYLKEQIDVFSEVW